MSRDMRDRRGTGFWSADSGRAELDRRLDDLVHRSATKVGEKVAKAIAKRLSEQPKVTESA